MRRRKRSAAVVWDGGTEDFICRDERCTVLEVHLAHAIHDTPEVIAARRSLWGWTKDPFEPSRARCIPRAQGGPGHSYLHKVCQVCGDVVKPVRLATDRNLRLGRPTSAQILDDIVLSVITPHTIKPFRVIYDAVLDDYGSIEVRRLRRCLSTLRASGKVAYLSFDSVGMVAGYTTPGSSLLADPVLVKEILWHQQSEQFEAA